MDKNIAIITSYDSHRYSGGGGNIYSLSPTRAHLYDHGKYNVGAVITYSYQDPHWAVGHKEIKNNFVGIISDNEIKFLFYDADVRFRKNDLSQNLQNQNIEGQTVSFSIAYDKNERCAYAQNIMKADNHFRATVNWIINERRYARLELEFNGEFVDYNWQEDESFNFSEGDIVFANLAIDYHDMIATSVQPT